MNIRLPKLAAVALALATALGAAGCRSPENDTDPAYLNEIANWDEARVASLKSDTGWLNLAGLFWLRAGTYTFGSDSSNDLVFPPGAPGRIGVFEVADSMVTATMEPDVEVHTSGMLVTRIVLKSDTSADSDAPTVLEWGTLRWWLIARDGRLGIRLRDLDAELPRSFEGIERYPVDAAWRVVARLEPHPEPIVLSVPTILGTIRKERSPGSLVLALGGDTLRLDPTGDLTSKLSLVFGDETTGKETYGGGRMLAIDLPDENGLTVIDFNRAYNPPCAFTPFSTCSQPPAQNVLPIAVRAGEMMYEPGAHP